MRCIIYTRKSTEERLEMRYNSLEAQRDACRAYIASHAHAGWTILDHVLDDGGFSGGTLERPALTRLLELVRTRSIDVIVVQKVDRLSRSLADFARLAELFDQHNVSFVSVTQQLDTSTAMGRLSLNVLLSFAQFEREIASERIREKIAASRRRGLWTGGACPYGYKSNDKRLLPDPDHAAEVRHIYERYAALKSVASLREELAATNRISQGKSRGALYTIIRSPIYAGKVRLGNELVRGIHEPIISDKLWEACQRALENNRRKGAHRQSMVDSALLLGKLWDEDRKPLTRAKTFKGSRQYHYYVSAVSVRGQGRAAFRVPCKKLDSLVQSAILGAVANKGWLADCVAGASHRPDLIDRIVKARSCNLTGVEISTCITKVMMSERSVTISFDNAILLRTICANAKEFPWPAADVRTISVPIPTTRRRTIDMKEASIASDEDWLACGRRWFTMLANGQASSQAQIARRERVSQATVSRAISSALQVRKA